MFVKHHSGFKHPKKMDRTYNQNQDLGQITSTVFVRKSDTNTPSVSPGSKKSRKKNEKTSLADEAYLYEVATRKTANCAANGK